MDFFQTLVLALVQGISEFLPVSSSAHLVFPSQLFGWPDQGLTFDVAVHFGTLTAVVLYYHQSLSKLVELLIHRPWECLWLQPIGSSESVQIQLIRNLLLASAPVMLAGLCMEVWLPQGIRSTSIIAWATIIFSLVLYVADKRGGHKLETDLVWQTALVIGLSQVFALIPGTSRSGVTIAAGLLLGMSASGAANFSFLLSIPTILAASVLKLLSLLTDPTQVDWLTLATGSIVSGVFAYLSIGWFISFLNRVGMVPFVIYRLILGSCLLLLF